MVAMIIVYINDDETSNKKKLEELIKFLRKKDFAFSVNHDKSLKDLWFRDQVTTYSFSNK